MLSAPKLPRNSQRLAIFGRTGSGKTVAGAWHLSKKNFKTSAWVIVDYKGDELLNEIGAVEIDLFSAPPKKPGLYIVHPLPNQEPDVDAFLWKLWARENIGVYVDEGLMLGNLDSWRAILTQGRSKHIPVIVLSQRPVWVSRFVLSEADFFQVFHLNDERDRQTVKSFMPPIAEEPLPNYWSYYYNVGDHDLRIMKPVPTPDEIRYTFSEILDTRRVIVV